MITAPTWLVVLVCALLFVVHDPDMRAGLTEFLSDVVAFTGGLN